MLSRISVGVYDDSGTLNDIVDLLSAILDGSTPVGVANKVSHALTIGNQSFDGSSAVAVAGGGEETVPGGFIGGSSAQAANGGAIGIASGTVEGGAVGAYADSNSGGAVGFYASCTSGGAVGDHAVTTFGGAVGNGAKSTTGFAGGYGAVATAYGAVQLGGGTNDVENTLKFLDQQICDADGNITGQYVTGTWLQGTANNHSDSAASKICVQDASGWVYFRTPAELLSDLGAASLSASQNWLAEQHFNAGFSALNNNFRFSDTTNIGMEIGRQDGTAGTPYIDFHTDGKSSTDYNSRILATGNSLQIIASGGMSLNGQRVVTDTIEEIAFNLNTEYFSFIMDGSSRRTNMFKLFGTDMVFVIVSLLTVKEIGKTSVFMLNEFESRYAGYRVQTGIVCRSAHEPVGRIRINSGGTALWLDTFDNVSIATGATLEATFLYRCIS